VNARITRTRSGDELDRDVHVVPQAGPAKASAWSGEFWTPIADRFTPGEEIILAFKDKRTGYATVQRVELDSRIVTNCRVEFNGNSPLA
jgi:hypothetical protein